MAIIGLIYLQLAAPMPHGLPRAGETDCYCLLYPITSIGNTFTFGVTRRTHKQALRRNYAHAHKSADNLPRPFLNCRWEHTFFFFRVPNGSSRSTTNELAEVQPWILQLPGTTLPLRTKMQGTSGNLNVNQSLHFRSERHVASVSTATNKTLLTRHVPSGWHTQGQTQETRFSVNGSPKRVLEIRTSVMITRNIQSARAYGNDL